MNYTKQDLMNFIDKVYEEIGKFPSRREMRKFGMSEDPFYRIFGSLPNAENYYHNQLGKMVSEDSNLQDEVAKPTVKDTLIDTLKKNLSVHELKALVASTNGFNKPRVYEKPIPEVGMFKFLLTGDSHIGHKQFREDWWEQMIERAIKADVDFMYHTGDILEGMSGRPGHVYELSHIGFEAQFNEAKRLIQDIPFDMKFITGNHDDWYSGKADQGINVGKRFEESLNNVVFLGNGEADDIVNGIKVKLWHGNDGASYALSYRTQKFIEMLSGGEKPNILLAGHAHKSVFYETRNVSAFESGTLCMQSSFMRGKKLAAHTGFWIVTVYSNERGVSRIVPEWNAFYC